MPRPLEQQLRAQMAVLGRRLYAAGLVAGTDGNLSARLSAERLLITPSGVPKGRLRPADMVSIDLDGRAVGRGQPSSELGMHLCVYRQRSDVRAAVHAHPPWTIAASIQAGLRFDFAPEGVATLGRVVVLDYARPGTPAVADGLRPHVGASHCFILARHGSLALGATLDEAYHRTEALEHNAKIALLALGGGQLTPLPAAEIEALRAGAAGYSAGAAQSLATAPTAPPVRGRSRVRISDEEPLVP